MNNIIQIMNQINIIISQRKKEKAKQIIIRIKIKTKKRNTLPYIHMKAMIIFLMDVRLLKKIKKIILENTLEPTAIPVPMKSQIIINIIQMKIYMLQLQMKILYQMIHKL